MAAETVYSPGACLALTRDWQLLVRRESGMFLAHRFARFIGQFYDRAEFDAVARKVNCLFRLERDGEQATVFRAELNRKLRDAGDAPVPWQLEDDYRPLPQLPAIHAAPPLGLPERYDWPRD